MREYRIAKSDLGWNIYKRKIEESGIRQMRFLDGKGAWTLNKTYARTFYRKEDATDILGLVKIKDGKNTD